MVAHCHCAAGFLLPKILNVKSERIPTIQWNNITIMIVLPKYVGMWYVASALLNRKEPVINAIIRKVKGDVCSRVLYRSYVIQISLRYKI